MEELDADGTPLKSFNGQTAAADIVQFVPFNQFKSEPHLLAKETLREVPGQLMNWMNKANITPNIPQQQEQEEQKILESEEVVPEFFANKKKTFVCKAVASGFEQEKVHEIIEKHGLCDEKYFEHYVKDGFVNGLYRK